MVCKKKGDDARQQPGEANDSETYIRFKAVYVFDVAQTDGEQLPEPTSVTGNPGTFTDNLKAFAAKQAIKLEYSNDLGGADGMSTGGKITLREGLDQAEEFSVLVHELAHEMLQHGENGTRPQKTVRETEAEAVAFVVSQSIGLGNGTASSDYIQLYAGDKNTLAGSLDRIQKTACLIIEAITLQDAAGGVLERQ